VKALGDSVLASKTPHDCNLFSPGIESIAERNQGREPATTEVAHVPH